MSELPPSYTEATFQSEELNPTSSAPEKIPYPPGAEPRFSDHTAQPSAPQLGTFDPSQTQEQYPHIQQPYPPIQHPVHYPPGYVLPHPIYPQPEPANTTTVTQVTRNTGSSGFYIFVIVGAAFSIICCFPLGIAALILAIFAYSEFNKDTNEPQRALGLGRIACGLGVSAVIIGFCTCACPFIWFGVVIGAAAS